MAITYTWQINEMKTTTVENTEGVVIQTYWKKIGVDENGNIGIFSGATPFIVNTLDDNFIPFSELKEADVISWIQNVVINDYENHVNSQIQKQIEEKKNLVFEVSGNSLPWIV